jgi:hypothetical protein
MTYSTYLILDLITLKYLVKNIYYEAPYKLTPQSRVLLEKLIVTQSVKKFLAFHGT